MKVEITRTQPLGDLIEVTFKYWNEKECACLAKIVKRTFKKMPTTIELLKSV